MLVDDAQIGRNVSRLRRDRTQKEIAERMRDVGWKWSQATVWSVERGERSLKTAEGEDLAAILGCASADFTQSEELSSLSAAVREMTELSGKFVQLVDDYAIALWNTVTIADEIDHLSPAIRARITDWVQRTPMRLVEDASGPALARAREQSSSRIPVGASVSPGSDAARPGDLETAFTAAWDK